VLSSKSVPLFFLLGFSVSAFLFSGISLRDFIWRLAAVNIFVFFLFLVVPFGSGGKIIFDVYGLEYGSEGLARCLRVALKSNIISTLAVCFVCSSDPVSFGHTLAHLKVPSKIAYLFLFTVRYINLIHEEYFKIKRAMIARAFRPGFNFHSYGILAKFAGLVLLKSFERAEKIALAMKARSFNGNFYMLEHFKFGRKDFYAGAFFAVFFIALIFLEMTR
jgi:cobalt/nickel transport system permease protein